MLVIARAPRNYTMKLKTLLIATLTIACTVSYAAYQNTNLLDTIHGQLRSAADPVKYTMNNFDTEAAKSSHTATTCYDSLGATVTNDPYLSTVASSGGNAGTDAKITVTFASTSNGGGILSQLAAATLVFTAYDSANNTLDCDDSISKTITTYTCDVTFANSESAPYDYCKASTFYGLPYPLSLCVGGTFTCN